MTGGKRYVGTCFLVKKNVDLLAKAWFQTKPNIIKDCYDSSSSSSTAVPVAHDNYYAVRDLSGLQTSPLCLLFFSATSSSFHFDGLL